MSQQDTPPAGAAKTKLKINIVNRTSAGDTSLATPQSARTVIKIKASGQNPFSASPASPSPSIPIQSPLVSAKTKAGRQTRPTKKLVEAIKRDLDGFDHDEEDSDQPVKKIKLRQAKAGPTTVRLKHKGKTVTRPLGEGYDSEASDRESDPIIEQQFVIRMPPGEHCEYVRRSIMENRFDAKAPERRLDDISLKFFDENGSRRAVMTVLGQAFAAVLLDLPTITETMKTWDRKSFLKSADICQLLLVFAPVDSEEEARTAPLPAAVESGHKWPHGLTPPMHDCVKRRFAKTISRKEIEDKEAEVERLLQEDRKALSTEWRWYDPQNAEKAKAVSEAGFEEDAEGEPDDTVSTPMPDAGEDEDDLDLQNALENELQMALDEEMAATPASAQPGHVESAPGTTAAAAVPGATQDESEASEEDEDDEEEDDDGDDDDEEEETDDEASEEQQRLRATKEIIADLRRQRAAKEAERDRANMPVMKNRCENQIRSITQEIKNKLRSIGIEEEDEEDEEE